MKGRVPQQAARQGTLTRAPCRQGCGCTCRPRPPQRPGSLRCCPAGQRSDFMSRARLVPFENPEPLPAAQTHGDAGTHGTRRRAPNRKSPVRREAAGRLPAPPARSGAAARLRAPLSVKVVTPCAVLCAWPGLLGQSLCATPGTPGLQAGSGYHRGGSWEAAGSFQPGEATREGQREMQRGRRSHRARWGRCPQSPASLQNRRDPGTVNPVALWVRPRQAQPENAVSRTEPQLLETGLPSGRHRGGLGLGSGRGLSARPREAAIWSSEPRPKQAQTLDDHR